MTALGVIFLMHACAPADDIARVQDAVKRSTLDQKGTKPFHLKATLAPTYERDRDSGRTGEVETWWQSPTRFRQEVRAPEFHQVEVVDGDQRWQRSEGDFYPDWLRVVAIELIRPVPPLDEVLRQVKDADVKRMAGSTYFSWMMMSSDGKVQKAMGASLAITDKTGLLFYGGGLEWGAIFHDYQAFHNRLVPRKVGAGSPEVTATVTTLEDLGKAPSSLFDTHALGGDVQLLDTVVLDESSLRKHLLATEPVQWPPLKNGPFEGILTTKVVVDREGRVREVGTIVSDNPEINGAARSVITNMRFTPFVVNGVPVQVVSRVTMPFSVVKTPVHSD